MNNHTSGTICQKAAQKGRRQFLRQSVKTAAIVGGSVGVSSFAAPALASALTVPAKEPDRKLRLVNAHTWEKLDIVFWTDGMHIDESMSEISYLMRDHRANESITIDTQLIDDLYNLYQLLDTDERIHILSGYRTQATNAKLRKRSNGVAKYSLHMEGKAVDLNVPGKTADQIRLAALSMKSGGVGYYPSSGFVHIDTGNVRAWNGS